MSLLAVGHKRTGTCPTFDRPVLQRDGHLLRVPLVGGALSTVQARAIAGIAEAHGNSIIELTNRGNLQIRGVRPEHLESARGTLRDLGLGDPGAALVTISPFADEAASDLRNRLVIGLGETTTDAGALSPKFVVHVDDAGATTAGRRAEATLTLVEGACRIGIDQVGEAVTTVELAIRTVQALADACRSVAADARVADVIDAFGLAWIHAVLPVGLDAPSCRQATTTSPPIVGPYLGPDGITCILAGARFGRLGPYELARLASLRSGMWITPWRSIAVRSAAATQEALMRAIMGLGLIVDPAAPAAGVLSCIGAAGCWQTEADTLAEAERFVARSATADTPAGIVHISGCDKRCATRSPVALTLLGRPDGSGFDEVGPE